MKLKKHPSEFCPEATDENLSILAQTILTPLYLTYQQLNTRDDDNYSRGTTTYARQKNNLFNLARSGQYSWLSIVKSSMDFVLRIGSIEFSVMNSDKNANLLKNIHVIDDLFTLNNSQQPLTWRLIFTKPTTDGYESCVTFVGYNYFFEVVSEWQYQESKPSMLHSVDRDAPVATELPPAFVDIRSDADLRTGSDDK